MHTITPNMLSTLQAAATGRIYVRHIHLSTLSALMCRDLVRVQKEDRRLRVKANSNGHMVLNYYQSANRVPYRDARDHIRRVLIPQEPTGVSPVCGSNT